MAWKVESVESQKQKFILLYQTRKFTKVELCREFGISRPTGDAIIKRYQEEGWDALEERSRRPTVHPNRTHPEVEKTILDERTRHPLWGARKIRELLFRNPEVANELVPSETTVNAILKKNGLTVPRRKGLRRIEKQYPFFDPQEPNEIWSTDFKGKFRMGNRVYCNPLTIADSKSRYLFAIQGLERADTESCKPIYEKVFREQGLPLRMHSDNGAPFGNALSLRRMTRLSVWFMEIGITPVYSDPGQPQQNGRHERMHRDLKAAATRPPGANFRSQQKIFNAFRDEYNDIRPHEGIGMKTPSEVHTRSNREYPRMTRDWDYDRDMRAKMVTVNGAIRWGNHNFIMVSTALSGKYIGLKEVETGLWSVYYRHVQLGILSEPMMKVYDLANFNV